MTLLKTTCPACGQEHDLAARLAEAERDRSALLAGEAYIREIAGYDTHSEDCEYWGWDDITNEEDNNEEDCNCCIKRARDLIAAIDAARAADSAPADICRDCYDAQSMDDPNASCPTCTDSAPAAEAK